MPRIRTVKPGLFKNEELAELPMSARLLFIGLFCLADKEGRLEDRPKRVKAELFPYDNIDVDDQLSRLQSAGFISRYEVGEMKVIQVVNFTKHQVIRGSEALTESTFPSIDGKGNHQETPRKPQGSQEGKGKGKEGNKEGKGIRPTPDFEIELDEVQIGSAIEYLTLTKKMNATREIVLSLWTVFKTKNFTGQKFYEDESDIRRHFFNSLKYEQSNNGTAHKPGGAAGSKADNANAYIEKARARYDALSGGK